MNVILAIPMSLLGTVAVIYFLGFTLNTFTLLALSLAVGIVVDDAIMVLENIYRHSDERQGPGARRRARGPTRSPSPRWPPPWPWWPSSSRSSSCRGSSGKFFLQFGVTLCVAVLLSYLEAITLAPARSAQILRPGHEQPQRLGRWTTGASTALARGYAWVLARGLRWPGWCCWARRRCWRAPALL